MFCPECGEQGCIALWLYPVIIIIFGIIIGLLLECFWDGKDKYKIWLTKVY